MTRDELIAAVLADPSAYWAVLLSDQKIAGPWQRRERRSVRSLDADGQAVDVQRKEKTRAGTRCPEGHEGRGNAPFCSQCGSKNERVDTVYEWLANNRQGRSAVFSTREEAEAYTDFWLAADDYLLVPEEV